jgi:hypothetical protein
MGTVLNEMCIVIGRKKIRQELIIFNIMEHNIIHSQVLCGYICNES